MKRRGYTLVELLISSVSAAFLMAGLASALFIAGEALNGRSAAAERARAADVQAVLLADLEHATAFLKRGSDSVTFTVPDRDGDGAEEILAYAWSSSTGELTLSLNEGTPSPVLTGVKGFQLDWFSRLMESADSEPPPLDPAAWGKRW